MRESSREQASVPVASAAVTSRPGGERHPYPLCRNVARLKLLRSPEGDSRVLAVPARLVAVLVAPVTMLCRCWLFVDMVSQLKGREGIGDS
jgi:hypothetical protein